MDGFSLGFLFLGHGMRWFWVYEVQLYAGEDSLVLSGREGARPLPNLRQGIGIP